MGKNITRESDWILVNKHLRMMYEMLILLYIGKKNKNKLI